MERRHRINGENTPKHQPEIPETTDGILDLLSLAPYGAYAVDISQIIVFWNRSAERILGHKADRIIGHRCYEVLQHLPGEGSTPICMEGCPSIRLAREGRIPPVVRVRARCVSGLRKEITVTPLIVPAAQEDRTLLLPHFSHWQGASSIAILGLSSQQHTVRFALVDSTHTELTNPEAASTLTFTVAQPPTGEFTLDLVADGLNFPVRMAATPAGRLFYNEMNSGQIRVLDANFSLLPQPFYSGLPRSN